MCKSTSVRFFYFRSNPERACYTLLMEKGGKSSIKRVVLLDSHAIIHRAYHALPDFMASNGEPTGALYGLSNMLMKIIGDLKPDYILACYDLPQKTFRHEAYDSYKDGRVKADEALISQIKNSRLIFDAFDIPIYSAPGFEADDCLGTLVEILSKKKEFEIIIASGDMDTMQLVDGKKVQIFTLKKGITDTVLYDEAAVLARYGFAPKLLPDFKGLRGDPSDNIIGIKGIGEKTATTLISNFGTIENIYKELKKKDAEKKFKDLGITERIFTLLKEGEEEAIFSKTLAKIRTDAPLDFTLPKKTFWEALDPKKIENVFLRFEFRSLFSRLKNFLNNGAHNNEEIKNFNPKSELDEFVDDISGKAENQTKEKDIAESELTETSIALWLLNSDISVPNLSDILMFAKTQSFEKAREYIFKTLKEKNLQRVYEEVEKPIINIVSEMSKTGILIDKKYFEKLSKEFHTELDKLTKKIYEQAGEDFNINSPKQLGSILFEKLGIKTKKKTAGGALSTKAEVLEELAEEFPIVQDVLEYREFQKLVSTYVDVIPTLAGQDGRLHSRFIQHGTTTGRFASIDPNLQNLPVKSEAGRKIRAGFVARAGTSLLALDYSQIELRVGAILSDDQKMIEIFKEGKDIHAGVASFVFGVPIDAVDAEMRRRAKVINFGIIYGMGVSALRKSLGGTREEAQKFYDNYFDQFSGIRDYLESVKVFAVKNGYTETMFGRRRYFPNINSRIPFLKAMAERTAINAPIQGTAADVIKLAIRYTDEDLEKAGLKDRVKLVLQIHDELVYEVEDSVLEKASKIIKNSMESVLTRSFIEYKGPVPLLVSQGSGKNFGEVK